MKTIRFQRLLTACSVMLFLLTAACTKEPSTSPAKTKTEEAQPSPSAGSPLRLPAMLTPHRTWKRQPEPWSPAKWTGDLDGMIKRRLIRVLTVYSKTGYFVDRGTQRGLTYESFQLFEEDLNKKLKNKNVRVHRRDGAGCP